MPEKELADRKGQGASAEHGGSGDGQQAGARGEEVGVYLKKDILILKLD
jgi:hypothetical protein